MVEVDEAMKAFNKACREAHEGAVDSFLTMVAERIAMNYTTGEALKLARFEIKEELRKVYKRGIDDAGRWPD